MLVFWRTKPMLAIIRKEIFMDSEIHGNMTDAQLFECLMAFKSDCQNCRVAHHACRVVPDCKECEKNFWIRKLSEHFGIKLEMG